MIYLVIGTIISLTGVGLIMKDISLFGVLFLIIGVSIGLKGRNEIDKKRK